jgi:hypothetical protein
MAEATQGLSAAPAMFEIAIHDSDMAIMASIS